MNFILSAFINCFIFTYKNKILLSLSIDEIVQGLAKLVWMYSLNLWTKSMAQLFVHIII